MTDSAANPQAPASPSGESSGAAAPEPSVPAAAFQKNVAIRCVDRAGQLLRTFEMRGGMNLWVFLRKNGLPVGAACSGVGVCAACHVRVEPPEGVTAASAFEVDSLARNGRDPSSERLACLCRVLDDVSVSADYW